jgi:YD repeat-containing protein
MRKLRYTVIGMLFILFISGICTQSLGQAPQNTLGSVTIASPTAASLGKFADIPVSYHTGVPEVEIPIYTVQAGPLKLPISLAYHASGLKVMEPAGWVGAGWALNAGGVITRTVNGQPDEVGAGDGGQLYGHFSHWGYNNYLYNGSEQDWQGFGIGQKDGEPDLFFFNFGGYTGKFYFRDDRTPVLVPEQDLQITPSYSGGRSIDYFTITTPDGTRYIFGNSPNVSSGAAPIETTNSVTAANIGPMPPPTSSWYLNQVVSADNQFTINLTYQAESYGYYTLALFPVDAATQTGPDGISGYGLTKNVMQGVRLSQISFPNGTVNFTPGAIRTDLCDNLAVMAEQPNSSATSLAGIQINDGNGFCKNYQLYTSYFIGNNTALPASLTAGNNTYLTDINRLRLDSVKESSCDGSLNAPPYKFTYFNGTLPRRLSFGVDHWGYYNGADGNAGLIPTIYVNNTPIPGVTRDAAWPAMMVGMLTQINYPTGGYRTFDFEPNSAIVGVTTPTTNTLCNQILGGPIFHNTNTTYSISIPCISVGTMPVTLQIQTNCNYGGNITIIDASGNIYFSTAYNNTPGPAGSETQITQWTYNYSSVIAPFMPAGNYTIQLTLGGNPPVGGVWIQMYQPTTGTSYETVTLGGLRIKTITAVDGLTSNNVVTNYSYTDPSGNSSGVLYSIPTYATAIRNDIIENEGEWSPTTGFTQSSFYANGCPTTGDYLKSPGSIRPMESVQGSIIGYQTVTVSQPGNGSSVYTYYTTNDGYSSFSNVEVNNTVDPTCDNSIPNYPPAPLPFDSKRGELYSEQHYDNSGNLLKDVYYTPTYNESPILSTPAFIVKARSIGGNTSYLGTNYSLNTVKKTSMLTIEHDYNTGAAGGYVQKITTTYYGSNFHNQPTRVVTSTSTGDTLATNTTYAADFRLAACDAISDGSTEYTNACNACQSAYATASNACNGSSTCITTAYLNYMQCNTNARISYVNLRKTNYMVLPSQFSQCHQSAESGADANLKPVLLLQDEYSNPAIESSQWKDANLLHASYTQFNPSTTPAGYVYPGSSQLINLQASSPTFSPATVAGTTISRDSRYLNESSYTFTNGNPQQVLGHDGIPISYLWNYNNVQPVAKITNATTSQVAYTSFEGNGTGNWTYTGVPTADATAVTGGYSYNLGQASASISLSGLSATTTYVVSYWSKTGNSNWVNGVGATTRGKSVTINGGAWTYFEHVMTGVTSVTVTGAGNIDELRLYPQNSQMMTYTYSPLVGMTSSCDVDNRVTYYTYDALGRLRYIRDQNGNMIKTYQYHYQGQ